MKYKDIKTAEELRTRIQNNTLSVGCYLQNIRHLLTRERAHADQEKVVVVYSPGYGGTASIIRYI